MAKKKAPKQMSNYEIRAAHEGEAELLIYGDIGESWWSESVEAKAVAEELSALDVQTIVVRINSYGGSVSDGLAIFNALRMHDAEINVRIDGVAVSIASLIAMAGDTVEMAENALFMVHAPWGGTVGNSKEMREYADMLDIYAKAMTSSYVRQTGKDSDIILDLLTDGEDHWYTAEEAKEFGFVDSIIEEEMAAAAGFDKSRFIASKLKNNSMNNFTPAAVVVNSLSLKEKTMSTKAKKSKATTAKPADPVAVVTEPVVAEPVVTDPVIDEPAAISAADVHAANNVRIGGIRSAFNDFIGRDGVQALLDGCIDNHEINEDQARAKLLAHLGKGAEPLSKISPIATGESEREKFIKGAGSALLVRAGVGGKDDTRNNFRGYSLLEMARKSLVIAGVNTDHMDKMEMVAAAFTHGNSDFTNILANVANKAMLKGYEESEETFQAWVTTGELPDFKVANRVDINSFPSLRQVRPGAEYKYATVGDRGETIQLATYGELFSINRQTIINDDLSAFTRVPMKMGRAAIRTVGDLVYAILTSNPNMSDGVALFHANHSNLLTAAGISTAGVDAMRVAMATQKQGDALLNIRLANLLVPVALEGTAKVVRDSEFEVGASTKNNTTPNSVRATFEVISDARLDAASASNWYGAAAPGSNDTIEVSYLDGNDRPVLEQQNGWMVDGTEFKVRIDAGVSPLDFRTMAKNPN